MSVGGDFVEKFIIGFIVGALMFSIIPVKEGN